ncbi:MAG: hypothetical protein IKQ97_06415, partial [Eubacterium sp.]|nr:hypothetical protein [Eubacterium sp.]
MYLSKKYHPLTQTLFVTTGIQLLANIVQMILRWYLRRKTGLPDMLDDRVWVMTMIVDGVALLGMLVVIWFAMKKLRSVMRSVDAEDQVMMRRLQEDTFGKDLSALPADLIFKVLGTWASILVG